MPIMAMGIGASAIVDTGAKTEICELKGDEDRGIFCDWFLSSDNVKDCIHLKNTEMSMGRREKD